MKTNSPAAQNRLKHTYLGFISVLTFKYLMGYIKSIYPKFALKIASLGPILVGFLVKIWCDKSLIWIFLFLISCLAALE